MPTTTVLSEDTATIIDNGADTDRPVGRFSWSAAVAGAVVAMGVTFFLLTLGSGVGLSLVSVRGAASSGVATFLTLGAIYFLAAQAFGFAAGGHVAGRLIGPVIESVPEEEFRAGVHGLVVWALSVVVTAAIVAAATLVAGSAASQGAVLASLAPSSGAHSSAVSPIGMSYWVDDLFRAPANRQQASLFWRQIAQADTGNATDANQGTATQPQDNPATQQGNATTQQGTTPDDEAPTPSGAPETGSANGDTNGANAPTALTPAAPVRGQDIAGDKAETARILNVDMRSGGLLSSDDRDQVARLVSQDAGWTFPAAQHRVSDVETRIHENQVKAADGARRIASYAALWTALALLFGAVVATAAAISARWEDDRQSMLPSWRAAPPK